MEILERHPEIILRFTDQPELVLTNKAQTAIRFWKPDNSWGWQIIQLQVHAADQHFSIAQKNKIFTRNGPGFFVIQSGATVIFDLFWGVDNWHLQYKHQPVVTAMELKAVFDIPVTQEATELGIITGVFSSNAIRLNQQQSGILLQQLNHS